MPSTHRPAATIAGAALALCAVLVLSGCSGSSSPSSATTPTPSSSGTANAGGTTVGGAGAGVRGPAASGQIAAVSGSTMQVQDPQTGQVAVTWLSSTKFTQQVTLAASAIKVGECVTAVAASGTSSTATSFAATTVSVTQPTNGSCRAGGAFSGRPSGFPTGARPSGFPTGRSFPSGFPTNGSGIRATAIASGSVVSVSGSTIVVASRTFTPGSGSTPSATTTNKTVTLTPSTKITTQQAATASAVQVGRCATAQGSTDSTGAVTATSINITDPVNGTCTTRFIGFGGAGGTTTGGTGA